MDILWVVLLDSSYSMAEPLTSAHEFRGHLEVGSYQTKIAAAKHQLVRELHGLGGCHVTVVEFNDVTRQLYSGPASAVSEVQRSLEAIVPHGRTDIGAALEHALATISQSRPHSFASILLVSDGLSTVGDPLMSSKKCLAARLPVSTILINPTADGEALAKAISVGGRVWGVKSLEGLNESIAKAAEVPKDAHSRSVSQPQATPFVLLISAVLMLFLTAANLGGAVVKDPRSMIPIILAVMFLLLGAALLFVFFAKEQSPVGLYLSPADKEPTFPVHPKYSAILRWPASFLGLVCFVGSCVCATTFVMSSVVQVTPAAKTQRAEDTKDSVSDRTNDNATKEVPLAPPPRLVEAAEVVPLSRQKP